LAGRYDTLSGHQLYKIFPPHPYCFAALQCKMTFVQKFHFLVVQDGQKLQN